MVEYEGIKRLEHPEWLGWVILDLLESNTSAPQSYRREIQVQLDYEVKLFHFHNKI